MDESITGKQSVDTVSLMPVSGNPTQPPRGVREALLGVTPELDSGVLIAQGLRFVTLVCEHCQWQADEMTCVVL